jgi:capsular polysaccharide biosynthesis protein
MNPQESDEARTLRRQRKRRARRLRLAPSQHLNPLEGQPLATGRAEERQPPPWRWIIDGLTYFNRKPPSAHLPVVEHVPLVAETIAPAFVSGMFYPASARDTFSGAVYRADRRIVPEFLEFDELTKHRVPKRVNAPVIEPARVAEAGRIDAPCVYLGPYSGHFGHFLLESLPRAWYLKEADPATLLLFHARSENITLSPFAAAILEALDIDPSRIRFANRDKIFSRLILPASQFWQGIKASPGMCVFFDHVREKMMNRRTTAGPTPRKVYLTRRSLGAVKGPGKPRAVIPNEEEAEVFFRSQGYEILRPETLRLEDQVAIVANATHVAGPSGSALHLMLFNANPQAKLIELRTKRAANQLLISAIRGNAAFHIWSTRDSSPERAMLDMDVIERAVREIG